MDRTCFTFQYVMISNNHFDMFFVDRVQGERYFTCRPNYGVFVRPDRVRVGDFPVEEINFDDEEI